MCSQETEPKLQGVNNDEQRTNKEGEWVIGGEQL